jgi:hypothetical protein
MVEAAGGVGEAGSFERDSDGPWRCRADIRAPDTTIAISPYGDTLLLTLLMTGDSALTEEESERGLPRGGFTAAFRVRWAAHTLGVLALVRNVRVGSESIWMLSRADWAHDDQAWVGACGACRACKA